MNAVLLTVFWSMQAIAQLFFKYGSDHPARWWAAFALGHVFGVSSILLLMKLYKTMNVNVALGLGIGGAFLCSQIVLALVYQSRPSTLQTLGILGMTAGMLLLATGGHASTT